MNGFKGRPPRFLHNTTERNEEIMAKVDMSMVPQDLLSETGRYKPGHDAKHVSILVAQAREDGFKVATVRQLAKQLPTDSLRAKFEKAIERAKATPVKKERA